MFDVVILTDNRYVNPESTELLAEEISNLIISK